MTYALEEQIHDLLGPSRSSGVNRMFRCCFHEERTPSLSVNMEEGLFQCFGCNKKGNYLTLCSAFGEIPDEGYLWEKAKRDAAYQPEPTYDFRGQARRHSNRYAEIHGRNALDDFLGRRGIGRETAIAFGLGLTPEGRISFPYWDAEGEKVAGIKYRDSNGNKSAESGSVFTGLYSPSTAIGRDVVIILEGESDTLRTYTEVQTGYPSVGICGTSGSPVSTEAWTRFGLSLLFASRIYLGYDADEAGDKCADVAMRVLGNEKCQRLRPPTGSDMSEFLMGGGRLEGLGFESSS